MKLECLHKRKMSIDKIKISPMFAQSPPNPEKLIKKTAEYIKSQKQESVYIDDENNLIDGYCTYLIIKALGLKSIKCVKVKKMREQKESG